MTLDRHTVLCLETQVAKANTLSKPPLAQYHYITDQFTLQSAATARENGGWSEQPWAGVRAIEDAVGDGVVAGLRQVDAVPVGVRRRVRAHAGAPHAAARLRVEVVRPSAAAARPQRPVPEPCRRQTVTQLQFTISEWKFCEFRVK